MPLPAGSRIGAYDIVATIGAGGMGEVYRARDARLGRDVAVKVLPPAFAQDDDRRARFLREARAVAALSHPNIVSIFDSGVQDEQVFIVMELLRGETLRQRLEAGALPVRKAIDIAAQIARGLAAARDAHLVHRDLKPDNIFLLPDGQVKILDFGLARRTTTNAADADTVSALTIPGLVMGTVGYMSPEQVRGEPTDARTDLFALGAVLYEMLSGRRAFQRGTVAETTAAILTEDPADLATLRRDIPPALDRIVRHCLEKGVQERFQSARDVAFALDALSGSERRDSNDSRLRGPAFPLLFVALAAGLIAAGALVERGLAGRPPAITFATLTHRLEWITRARYAPDGQTIVFSAAASGNAPQLFVLRPGATAPQALGQTDTHLLAVSSKGELAVLTHARYVNHFLFEGTLARMPLDGTPRPWLEHVREADWSPDGSTLAIVRALDTEDRLEYPIGTVLYRYSGYLSDPRVSPDGSRIAFFEHQIRYDNRGWLEIVGRDGVVKTLAGEYEGEDSPVWSRDGQRIYFSATERGGEPYQAMVVNVDGTPHPRLAYATPGTMVVDDIAADGRQLVTLHDDRWSMRSRPAADADERDVSWLDFVNFGTLSRDRQSLLFTDESPGAGADYATALRHLATDAVVRLGAGASLGLSPDGRWALSQIPSTGQLMLYPTGAGQSVEVAHGGIEHYTSPPAWFPISQHLLVCGNEPRKPPRCYDEDPMNGTLTPVTPEGTVLALVAGDDKTLLTRSSNGSWDIEVIGQSGASPAGGLAADDVPVAWSVDRRSVVVGRPGGMPVRVERVDLASGARQVIHELAPPERSGVTGGTLTDWHDTDGAYVYVYQRSLSTLYAVSGLG